MIEDDLGEPQIKFTPVANWLSKAACKGVSNSLFYPSRGKTTARGMAVCATCPVTRECYEYAVSNGETNGVWGGVNFDPRLDNDPVNLARIPSPIYLPNGIQIPMAASTIESPETVTITTVDRPELIEKVTPLIPTSLSASSVLKYLECPAQWRVLYIDKAFDLSNEAADLGSACHGALENFVVNGYHLNPDEGKRKDAMRTYYGESYWALFADDSRFKEGWNLLVKWMNRQDWTGRTVLSCEVKKSFMLIVIVDGVKYEIPFNYIMDRKDQLESGDIEVKDYKSLSRPVSSQQMKSMLQFRIYGLAAQMEHPKAKRIWVTADLLRHEEVGIVYTPEENMATWRMLQDVATRIIKDNQAEETLNDGCRWCIRANECDTLIKHVNVGGILAVTDPVEAAQRKYEIDCAIGGLKGVSDDLERMLIASLKEANKHELEVPGLDVSLGVSGRRVADHHPVLGIIGPEMFAEISGNPSIKEIEKLMQDDRLTTVQKSQLGQCIRMNYGDAKVTIKKSKVI